MNLKGLSIKGADPRVLVDSLQHRGYVPVFSSDAVFVLCKEKYYLRVSSKLLAVVVLNFDGGLCNVKIVSGGGRDIWGTSWGAEKDLNNRVTKDLEDISEQNIWQTTIQTREKTWQTTTQTREKTPYESEIIRKG